MHEAGKVNKEQCQELERKSQEWRKQTHQNEKHLETLTAGNRAETETTGRGCGAGKEIERIRCMGGRKMVDSSQPLITRTEVSQPSDQANVKGRPGLSVSGTLPPQGYLNCPHCHYEFSCHHSPRLFTETSEGFHFLSAEYSKVCWDLSDGEEPQETLSSPPRGDAGKGEGIANTWLQGVRRLNSELNSGASNIRIGVFSLHFVVDKYQGKIQPFIFFTLIYTTDSILCF